MQRTQIISSVLLALCGGICLDIAGCRRPPAASAAAAAAQQHRMQLDTERQQMELLPPPSKNRYLAVRSLSDWDNPFLTVQDDMLTLHVLQPDPISATMGQGTLLRPIAARRRDLTIRVGDLPDALAALPANDWPYGRVIALEEQRGISAAERPAMRRTMEAAIQTLTDLGIVVDEWNGNGAGNTR